MRSRITTLLVVATVATMGMPATAQAAGELTQKPGTAGCISEDTSKSACQDGRGLEGATRSPSALTARTPTSWRATAKAWRSSIATLRPGALTQRSGATACVTKDGSGSTCQAVKALAGAYDVAVSADGRNVYVAAFTGGVTIFDRDPGTGALDQKAGTAGCISSDGSGGTCEKGTAIAGASSVVVSADGRSVYVAAYTSGAVAIFDRDSARERSRRRPARPVASPRTAAAPARTAGRSAARRRSPSATTAGACTRPPTASSRHSPSPRAAASRSSKRDPATGALAQEPGAAGCVTYGGSEGACQQQRHRVLLRRHREPGRPERVRHVGAGRRDRAVRSRRRERRADAEAGRRARRRGQRGRRQPRRPQRVRRHARDGHRRDPRP